MQITHEDTWEQFLDEFFEIFSISGMFKYKILICGSYIEENFAKLKEIRDLINNIENHLGFFEISFKRTHNENLIYKFDLVAKFADEILMIIEHDKGGPMIEMGIIISIEEFLNKTKVFVLENAPITHMLIKGGLLTPFFIKDKNLFYFQDINELKSKISTLLKTS
ncbi:MAG: hypothetical protein ACFFAH_02645 [Promethearchaeota archaeon]